VFLYAYRHSFTQRHADAGTPVDVLRDLMGHWSMSSTQGYYSITAKRTRAAMDALAAFQFDRNGTRVWREKSSAPMSSTPAASGTTTKPAS
jgi:integrase